MQSEVRRLLPSLSRAQANVLGELVFAMLMVDGCGMTRICSYLSELLDQEMNTLRQKYREMYYEKEAKAGVVLTQRSGGCKLERVDSPRKGKGSCKRSNGPLH